MSDLAALAWVAAATLVSEDATCIATGLLIQQGRLDAATGLMGCWLGIFVGDLGLLLLGRLGRRVLTSSSWFRHRWSPADLRALSARLETRAAAAIVLSRFVPGTRLPMYLAAGVLGYPLSTFAWWTGLSVMVWVPAVVLGTAVLGQTFVEPLRDYVGAAPSLLLGLAAILTLRKVAGVLVDRKKRRRLGARAARVWRWEFWPAWALYAPVSAWIGLLAIRFGGLKTFTAANPAFPEGGFVGESKNDILRLLPARWTVPFEPLDPGPAEARFAVLGDVMRERGWQYPLVLKPDVGQRGVGVRRVGCDAEALACLATQPGRLVAQPWHSGPFEAGIFYWRMPGSPQGRIFSITDKRFAEIAGDGRSTLEDLIWAHPRYRMQADTFLQRHAADRGRVLGAGERFPLAVAGNHAQGTQFCDGAWLLTPALEARIDEIARSVEGFFVGRFDVRYRDVERFMRGEDLAIVELNGVTSESTNIYDPSFNLVRAWITLARQWLIIFRIGAANRRLGHEPAPLSRLLALSWRHLTTAAGPLSD